MSILKLDEQSNLYYEEFAGKADRPHLIFLHEGLGCVELWRDFPERLCQRTGCPGLVYDRLGYGKSSPLQQRRTITYLHNSALVELPQVIEALLPGRPFVLIGHSDGGSISLIFGAEQSPHLKGIITVAAHVFVEQISVEGIKKATEAFTEGKLKKGLSRYHGAKTEALFQAWSATWQSPWFASWNIEYLLSAISVPLLVLQGRDDPYGTDAQVQAIVAGAGGRATPALLEDCGHAPHQEFPGLALDLMTCYINSIIG
ncbi:MAG: alpha/beta fold hydrolase [Desulfobulbaceae bacterium]|nr:alpha/beta fold hydrolase [Desulfobulbaceae bacterium]